jgi:hypothetical protein
MAQPASEALPYKQGNLKKITDYMFDSWAQRYCYLDKTTFAYFKSSEDKRPRKKFELYNAILEGVFEKSNLFVITLRIEKDLITLGSEMRSTIEEWYEEFRKAIELANGTSGEVEEAPVHDDVIPISVPEKPQFPCPDIFTKLQPEIDRLREINRKEWNLVAVKSGCMIS